MLSTSGRVAMDVPFFNANVELFRSLRGRLMTLSGMTSPNSALLDRVNRSKKSTPVAPGLVMMIGYDDSSISPRLF